MATINSRNVPSGSPEPADPTYRLRSVTTSFEDFPSFRRNGDEFISKEAIAIELFLENPVLFFRHQGDFAGKIGGFDNIAKMINNLQPDVKWRSLGYIIRNYHLEKQKDDGNYDILMYANELTISNNTNVPSIYSIKKKEKSTEIYIKYGSETDFLGTDLGKNNYYYATLRYISDFRDIVLSKNKYGRIIVGSYYNSDSFKNLTVMFIGILCFCIVIVLYIYRKKVVNLWK